MNKILFSGIGGTDPFKGGFDGSMLHIVRHYKPKIVYLYFTKEMYYEQNKLKSCKDSILALNKNTKIIIIPDEKELISEAHLSDVFIKPFKKILKDIVEKHKESEILLNISSGTPSLKNTLLLLTLFNDLNINDKMKLRSIQVSSPNKKSNHNNKISTLDPKDIVSYVQNELLDNLEEAPNRTIDNDYENLKMSFVFNQIKTLIERYQYVAAYLIIEQNRNLFSKKQILLITHLKNRSIFNIKEADKDLKELGLNKYIIFNQSLKRIIEYFNIIKINEYNLSFHDTLIMLSTLIEHLFKYLIKDKIQIDLDLVTTESKVEKSKVKSIFPEIFYIFNQEETSLFPLKNHHLEKILNDNSSKLSNVNINLIDISNKIRKIRNELAHQVDINVFTKIDHNLIKKCLKIINANIKDIFKNQYKKEYEEIYDLLNEEFLNTVV